MGELQHITEGHGAGAGRVPGSVHLGLAFPASP